MPTLQTPKCVIGPDCNVPSLTCKAWFETKYGVDEWEKLQYIPRTIWAEYLHWFKTTLRLSIVNRTRVGALEWDEKEACFIVPIESDGKQGVVYARKVILATGLQGSGAWAKPSFIVNNLPKSLYSSVYESVHFDLSKVKEWGF